MQANTPRQLFERPGAHLHLLGAGGAGVSGLGRILLARGLRISGHDRAPSEILSSFAELDVALTVGESRAEDLPAGVDLVVRSAAVPRTDPQVEAALARGIPVLKYAEALGHLAPLGRTLAVAGTHGKTGTSWLLWNALAGVADVLGLPQPGALIGGLSKAHRSNALAGEPDAYFVAEACEYDRTFLQLRPAGALVLNVEEDHLDCYGDMERLEAAFARFLSGVEADGVTVLGRDVPAGVGHGSSATVWRLGRELSIQLLGETRGAFRLRVLGPGWASRPFQLSAPGHFVAENAALALGLVVGILSHSLGLDPKTLADAAASGLERFQGVSRRFELWGATAGVSLVHDYAHHPTEVRVTLEAALRAFPSQPLHVLFQPHQHSRTSRFLEEFADSLRVATRVVIADVYGARVHIDGERYAGAPELVQALRRRGVDALEGGPLGSSVPRFLEGLPDQAAAFVLGAGDIELAKDDLLRGLGAAPSAETLRSVPPLSPEVGP